MAGATGKRHPVCYPEAASFHCINAWLCIYLLILLERLRSGIPSRRTDWLTHRKTLTGNR